MNLKLIHGIPSPLVGLRVGLREALIKARLAALFELFGLFRARRLLTRPGK